MTKIKDQVALVTGANGGIGSAFVAELLRAGVGRVYATARKPETLSDLAASDGGRVIPLELDITKPDQVNRLAADHGDVTLLINNAGTAAFAGLIAAGDTDPARSEMETNYFGTLNMVRAFGPVLAANGGGAIVNISSMAALVNFPVLGSYSASKAAVHSLTQGIRAELAAKGTHVLGVYPGPVDTRMAADLTMDKATPNEVARRVLEALEAGDEDVYPDSTAVEMHAGLTQDPKAVERQAGTMLPA